MLANFRSRNIWDFRFQIKLARPVACRYPLKSGGFHTLWNWFWLHGYLFNLSSNFLPGVTFTEHPLRGLHGVSLVPLSDSFITTRDVESHERSGCNEFLAGLHLPTVHGSHLLETLKLPTTKSKLISPTPSLLPFQTFALISPPLHSGYISAVVLRQSPLVQTKLA